MTHTAAPPTTPSASAGCGEGDGQNRRNKQHGHWRTSGQDGRLKDEGDYVDGKRVR